MNRLFVLVCVASCGAAHAQAVPQGERSVVVEVGTESFSAPVLQATLAPRALGAALGAAVVPLVVARIDVDVAAVSLGVGAQLEQHLSATFFMREAVVTGGFVAGVDGVALGVSGNATVQAGFDLGGVVIASGPALSSALVLFDGVAAGEHRVTPGWNVAVVVAVVDHLAFVGDASAGYDLGGHGDGALHGSVFVGARFSL